MSVKKGEKPRTYERMTVMNFLIALPGGVAMTALVISLIHFGSIATVGL